MLLKTFLNILFLLRFSEGRKHSRGDLLTGSLAEDANLEMVYRRSFHEMYEDEKDDATYGRLLDRMGVQDEDGNRGIKSISEEWDAAGLYLSFAFEKRGGY
jgi:mRNA capping enzyme